MSTNRVDKVNSLLEHEISQIILREFDFTGALVTLTHVETTANLIEAKVYISVFPEEKAERAIKSLNNDVFHIQQKINKKLNMRPIPRIKFVEDKDISHAGKIEELLSKIKK